MSHVRLACIARNEADKLPELAANVRDLIDSWIICIDPRTTDDTERVAYEVFDGIPGKVIKSKLGARTFDFGRARNELMRLAQEDGVHLLLLDCDSPCVGELPKELDAPCYVCDVRDEKGWAWKMPFLVRSDAAGTWHLPAHEYLELLCAVEEMVYLPDVYIRRTGAGANEARLRWSAEKLSAAAELDNEDAARATYFLGNVHLALGEKDEALHAFIKRVGMEGAAEETFFAMYQVGQVLLADNPVKAARAFLDAWGMRSGRVEPLFWLAHLANIMGNYQMALIFANEGLATPPSNDTQFIERWIEEWGMDLQWAIAAHYLGMDEAPEVLERVLACDPPQPYRNITEHYLGLLAEPEVESESETESAEIPKWFAQYADQYFDRFLTPLAGERGFKALQIGCFAGDASEWLLDHVLTAPDAHLDDVDTWEGSEDIHAIDFRDVEAEYDKKTSVFGAVVKHKTTSGQFLRSLPLEPTYDFIYIDGDHTSAGTLEDAVGAYPRLKVGGLLAFDDFTWRSNVAVLKHPYPAINAFMSLYADKFEVLCKEAQVWLKKVA